MYHVSAQGVDERMINVHYYYQQNLRRDGSSFMWLQPCQCCKYTTSVDIQKTRYKKLFTHVESYASAVSLLESGE